MSEQYVTHFINAKYAEVLETRRIKVKVGTQIVKRRKGIFDSEIIEVDEDIIEVREEKVNTGKVSNCKIDASDLSKRIANTCNECWQHGYELVQMIDSLRGHYNFETKEVGSRDIGWGYGYGYSVTDGVVLLFRKRSE